MCFFIMCKQTSHTGILYCVIKCWSECSQQVLTCSSPRLDVISTSWCKHPLNKWMNGVCRRHSDVMISPVWDLVSCKSSVSSHAANHQEAHAALCQCQSVWLFDFTTRWQCCAQSSCSPFIGLPRDASAWATEMCIILFYMSCTRSSD